MANDFLRLLNLDDLHQRYKDTYIKYGGKVGYCNGFAPEPGYYSIYFTPIGEDAEISKFEADKMCIERPRAQFYKGIKGKESCVFHISYPTRKQFNRGLTDRNTVLWFPSHRDNNFRFGDCIKAAFETENNARIRYHLKTLFDMPEESFVVSPQMAFVRSKDELKLYFRTMVIGHIKIGSPKFLIYKKNFATEVAEVLVDAKIEEDHEAPQPQFRDIVFNMPLKKKVIEARVEHDQFANIHEENYPQRETARVVAILACVKRGVRVPGKVFTDGRNLIIEFEMLRVYAVITPDGKVIWYNWHREAIKDDDRDRYGIVWR